MKAVVLAAGQGVRMLPLTQDRPKALVELDGKPLLWHVLSSLSKARVSETIIVVGFKSEMVKEKFGERFGKMKLSYVSQSFPMGTGHALFQARKTAGVRFLAGYCDVIVEPALWKKLAAAKGKDAVLALRHEKYPERFGVALTERKKLVAIVEKPEMKLGSDLVNVGAYLFTEKIFPALEKIKMSKRNEFELTDAINRVASEGKAGFAVYDGKCLDIGTIEDLENAKSRKG